MQIFRKIEHVAGLAHRHIFIYGKKSSFIDDFFAYDLIWFKFKPLQKYYGALKKVHFQIKPTAAKSPFLYP